MAFSGSPFSSEGVRKSIGPDEATAANELSQQQRMAALDDEGLRDLERAEFSGQPPTVSHDAAPATRRQRNLLDRLLRR